MGTVSGGVRDAGPDADRARLRKLDRDFDVASDSTLLSDGWFQDGELVAALDCVQAAIASEYVDPQEAARRHLGEP